MEGLVGNGEAFFVVRTRAVGCYHVDMAKPNETPIAFSIPASVTKQIDDWVRQGFFKSSETFAREAVLEKIAREDELLKAEAELGRKLVEVL